MSKEAWHNLLAWLLIVLITAGGYYLGNHVTATGLVIVILVLVIVNLVCHIAERGRGMGLTIVCGGGSFWFLVGFVAGLIVYRWGPWFK